MNGHTPGPWNATLVPTQIGSMYRFEPLKKMVMYVDHMYIHNAKDSAWDESHANALLITSAPELLAALIAFEEFGNVMHVRKQISEAIAKATGASK